MKISRTIEEPDWEFMDYAFELEKQWRASLARFTDNGLLVIFPETRDIISEKIRELGQKRDGFSDTIKKKLAIIKHTTADEFSRWFWREWIKITDGVALLNTESHIGRLERLLSTAKGKKSKERLTEEQIQQALAAPIENLISQPLRKGGKTLVGLCPLHNEKTPSFHVYPANNSFYCYGCSQGGDVITFVRLLHDYSFKAAVQYLMGNNT